MMRTWLAYILLCIGMFMAILDIQIVATALPNIQQALRMKQSDMSWVQTAYLTAEVIAIPLTGLLTRAFTMRWLFIFALCAFTMASVGCAMSAGVFQLIVARTVQGFAGGMLIPIVFSAVYQSFPLSSQPLATMVGGVLAVLAPTLGPLIGGWITTTYSWHWLFLINVPIGMLTIAAALLILPRSELKLSLVKKIDGLSLVAGSLALVALELGLKNAPTRGWSAPITIAYLLTAVGFAALFITRSCRRAIPICDLSLFRHRNFALGCLINFILGSALYGSLYLMPVFLAFVRGHTALQIGEIMLVTGVAQLATAPLVVWLLTRVDLRLLTGLGLGLLAIGMALSTKQTVDTDFAAMILPQALRGAAFLFCILPPTQLALGAISTADIPDASALFNLMRNLGGAIGLALIDTVLYGNAPHYATAFVTRLKAGDEGAARELGVPIADYIDGLTFGIDAKTEALIKSAVEHHALTHASNDAWAMVAALSCVAILALPFCKQMRSLDIVLPVME